MAPSRAGQIYIAKELRKTLGRILVIRLGAVGDFTLSFAPFAAIRHHHIHDHITLLTTEPFKALAMQSPWFDQVLVDDRPRWWQMKKLARLKKNLGGFDFVYDLQTSSRSSLYYRLAGKPQWSGIAKGASHIHANPQRDFLHTVERQRDQLAYAGITYFPLADLDWLKTREYPVPLEGKRYGLLVPGAAPHRPAKRWPVDFFAQIAVWMYEQKNILPVIIGAAQDRDLAQAFQARCPEAIDLTGKTTLADIAALAVRACFALGNDTGPMHLAAVGGCACLVLFSKESNPILTAPRGVYEGQVHILEEPDLSKLRPEYVQKALLSLLN